MPFEVKITPVEFNASGEPARYEMLVKTATRFGFKRLFERQFNKAPWLEKVAGNQEQCGSVKKDGLEGFEPSSVCLSNMVQNFMEDSNEKQMCGRNGCKCVAGKYVDSSDDEFDSCSCFGESNHLSADACENLKSLVPCQSVVERNLLADIARIVDQMKITKQKDDVCLNIVMDGLLALGYNASICKSHWEKSSTCPAGEYEYVDVVIGGERLIVDIDFRSEFEIARATKTYKSILQTLPVIFVGKSDRLQRIISMVMEAAKQSLKKKGMPFPPWRKAEYVKAKWLSAYTRRTRGETTQQSLNPNVKFPEESLILKEVPSLESNLLISNSFDKNGQHKMVQPESKFKNLQSGVKKIGGLTCIINDNP
ncbi:hypothetical protein LIER_41902 [Lithospermum erythrorhizon]|uniref:Uncharacterized protein n=1 Tax=Lithospermum erythrorhizon TaxID=34254 RepID=A0AAV3RG36_LITER